MGICLAFFAVVTIPPATTLYLLLNKHWIFEVLAFAGGWFCWTFTEYFIHRFWLHRKEDNHYRKSNHYLHHTHPGKIFTSGAKRLVSAVVSTLIILAAISLSRYLLLPAGFIAGFAFYCFLHLWLHQAWAQRRLRKLQQFHIQHHCGHPHQCFGVTVTWWDRLFNTIPHTGKSISGGVLNFYFEKTKSINQNQQK